MTRIELFVDRENRLTIDIYFDNKSENYIKRYKGQECYHFINEICSSPILKVEEISNEDVRFEYKNCIVNISEYEKVFPKRGMGPIKQQLAVYYNNLKKNNIKPKKVKRINKYVGREIIALALALSVLGAILVKKAHDENVKDKVPEPDPTGYTQETDWTPGKDDFIEELKNIQNEDITDTTKPIELGYSSHSSSLSYNDNKINISIDYEDRSETEKAAITKAYYGQTIEKYAKMYGLDPQVVIGIATQERGVHGQRMDSGGATGLMQIQNSVWVGQDLTAYNYETNQYDTVTVTKFDLSDVFLNIRYGCMIFQNCMDYMDNNILAAIQCYNMGYGNMMKILNAYSLECGKTVDQILSDVTDCGWLEHRDIITVGDQNYLEHVLSWIGPNIDIENLQRNVDLNINNNTQKNVSFN